MKEPIEKEKEPLQCVSVSHTIPRFILTLSFVSLSYSYQLFISHYLWLKWHIEIVIFPVAMTKRRQERLENSPLLKSRRPTIGKPHVWLLTTSRLKVTDLREKKVIISVTGMQHKLLPFSVSLCKFYKFMHFSYYLHY